MGVWKLSESKSSIGEGQQRNDRVVYSRVENKVKVTIDGASADGKPVHSEWTGKFDGKDYPVFGDPASDTRSYKSLNDKTLLFSAKKHGKVTTTGRIVLSDDGKTRTVTSVNELPEGKTITKTAIYEKQKE